MTSPSPRGLVCGLALVFVVTGAIQAQETTEIKEVLEALADEEWLKDPKDVMTWVEMPRAVNKGETVELRITIENARAEEPFREPRNKGKSLGDWSFEYPMDIPAGETREFQIRLRAKKTGIFIGDVDILEGENFLSRAAQIRVR